MSQKTRRQLRAAAYSRCCCCRCSMAQPAVPSSAAGCTIDMGRRSPHAEKSNWVFLTESKVSPPSTSVFGCRRSASKSSAESSPAGGVGCCTATRPDATGDPWAQTWFMGVDAAPAAFSAELRTEIRRASSVVGEPYGRAEKISLPSTWSPHPPHPIFYLPSQNHHEH